MRPKDCVHAERIRTRLLRYHDDRRPLPGIVSPRRQAAFLETLVESLRRVRYVAVLLETDIGVRRADPGSDSFDPLRAAILHHRADRIEEAFWLAFLATHFGKHQRAGWRYAREVYGRLGGGQLWDWNSVSMDVAGFRDWLHENVDALRRDDLPRGFGNHRKYESLDAYSASGTGEVIESYVRWIGPTRSHQHLIAEATDRSGEDPRAVFDYLYRSMASVARFGRLARFDYLTMVGKLELARIEPGSTYMQGATGPVTGARLLFGDDEHADLHHAQLDRWLIELDADLGVGMQVLEDALCNWQKRPDQFRPFRG